MILWAILRADRLLLIGSAGIALDSTEFRVKSRPRRTFSRLAHEMQMLEAYVSFTFVPAAIENAITPSSSSGGLWNFPSANAASAQGTFAAIFAAKAAEPYSPALASQSAATEAPVAGTTGMSGGNLQSPKVHGAKQDARDSQSADSTPLLALLLPAAPAPGTPVSLTPVSLTPVLATMPVVDLPAAAGTVTAATSAPDSVAAQTLAGSSSSLSSPLSSSLFSLSSMDLNMVPKELTASAIGQAAAMPQDTAPGSVSDQTDSSDDSVQPSPQPFSARVFSAATQKYSTMTPPLPPGPAMISSSTAAPRIPAVEATATLAASPLNAVPANSGGGETSGSGVTSAQVASVSQTAKTAILSRTPQPNDAPSDPTNSSPSDESPVEVSWLASPEPHAATSTSVFTSTLHAQTLPVQTPPAKMPLTLAQAITPQSALVAQNSMQSLFQGSGGQDAQNSNVANLPGAAFNETSSNETPANETSAPTQAPPQNPVVAGTGANNATTNSSPTEFVSPLTQAAAQAGVPGIHSPVLLPLSFKPPSKETDLTQSARNWFSESLNSASQQLRQNLPPAGNPPPHTAQTTQSANSGNAFSASASSGQNKSLPSNTPAMKSSVAASGNSAGTATASGSTNKNSQTGSSQNDGNNSAAQGGTPAAAIPGAGAPSAIAPASTVLDPTVLANGTGATSGMPQHKADDGTAAASSDPRANLPTAAEVPVAAPASPVQMAQMVNKAAQSEMRIGMNTNEFGNVEVRTVVHAGDVGVAIGSEKGDLRSLLANELPGIANTLQQQNLRLNQVNFHQSFAFSNPMSSGGDSQPRQFTSQSFSGRTESREINSRQIDDAAESQSMSAGSGLSILA